MSAADRIDMFFDWFFDLFYKLPKPIRWMIAPFLSALVFVILITAFVVIMPIAVSNDVYNWFARITNERI